MGAQRLPERQPAGGRGAAAEDQRRTSSPPAPGYRGEKLSLNFQNIDVRSLLQVIADFTNFNIVTSDTVQGSLTLRLKDVPWDQALDIILQSKGLGMKRQSGNVLWVAPKDELAAKEKAELEARRPRSRRSSRCARSRSSSTTPRPRRS
jgi:type II secretory pathway component HofQ